MLFSSLTGPALKVGAQAAPRVPGSSGVPRGPPQPTSSYSLLADLSRTFFRPACHILRSAPPSVPSGPISTVNGTSRVLPRSCPLPPANLAGAVEHLRTSGARSDPGFSSRKPNAGKHKHLGVTKVTSQEHRARGVSGGEWPPWRIENRLRVLVSLSRSVPGYGAEGMTAGNPVSVGTTVGCGVR